jgi:hypothetical protein
LIQKKACCKSKHKEAKIDTPFGISINILDEKNKHTSRDHTLTEPSKLEEINRVGSPTVPATPFIPGYSANEPISFI